MKEDHRLLMEILNTFSTLIYKAGKYEDCEYLREELQRLHDKLLETDA